MSRTAFAAAFLALSAGCGSGTKEAAPPPIIVAPQPIAPTAAPVQVEIPPAAPPAVVEPEPPLPPETPPPKADFTSLDDVVKAGKASIGKMVRLRVRRDHYTSATQFTAVPCPDRHVSTVWLRYRAEHHDWVRAMYDVPRDDCPTASFKVVAFHGGRAPLVEGSLEHVGTVRPKRAAKPEAGADYASIDDAIIAGADAKGKIISGSFWAYTGNPKELSVHDCKRSDSFLFVIPKTSAQQALAAQLSSSPAKCERAHLVMVDPDYVAGGGGESLKRPRADVVSVP